MIYYSRIKIINLIKVKSLVFLCKYYIISTLVTPSESLSLTDEFAINAEFEPHENEFLADDNYWQLDAFGFNVSLNSSICPTGNCEFEFEDGQINTDFSGDWVLTGRLKVGVETDEGTRSTLYDVRGELDRMETLETEIQ